MNNIENLADMMDLSEYSDIFDTLESETRQSKYVEVSELSKFIDPSEQTTKTLHLNVRSIPDKFDNLKLLLSSLTEQNIHLDFILLCETFLTEINVNMYQLPGYTFVYKNRNSTKGGGVEIYVKDTIKFKPRDDIAVFIEGEFESIFIEAELNDKQL